jgi:hypothetical protein
MRVGVQIGLGVLAGTLAAAPAGAVVGGRDGGPLAGSTLMVLNARGGVCTGIVLSPRSVLTAAHCAAGGTELRIHWKEGGDPVLLPPAAVALHPEFRANAVAARQRSVDLALLRLAQPLPGRFAPASLVDGVPPRSGAPVVLAGYGVSREGEARSTGVYRSATLSVVEPYGPGKILLWAADAAGAGKRSGPGACQGDSGGPMTSGDGQGVVAVTSWSTGPSGRSCGLLSQGVLVAPQRGWIDGTLAGWSERALWRSDR